MIVRATARISIICYHHLDEVWRRVGFDVTTAVNAVGIRLVVASVIAAAKFRHLPVCSIRGTDIVGVKHEICWKLIGIVVADVVALQRDG